MFYSIITPTYNSEKTLKKNLDSLNKQNFSDYEHIIIDKLSSDKTLQLAKSFGKNIKIISEKDEGIYHAMNKGASISAGHYLLFLNSDDFILDKSFLSNVYCILKNKNIDICYSNIKFKKNIFGLERKYISGDFKKNLTKLGWHIPHPGTFIKKEYFNNLGMFSKKFMISSDFDFFIKSQNNVKTRFYYYDYFTIKMSLGGASSGFINIVKANIECYASLKENKIKNSIQFIIIKILRKIFQLF